MKNILTIIFALVALTSFAQGPVTQWPKITYTTSHQLESKDYGKEIYMDCASPCNFTFPTNATLPTPITTYLAITPLNSQVTIVLAGGVSMNKGSDQTLTVTKGSTTPTASFRKRLTNTWQSSGLDCSTCTGGGGTGTVTSVSVVTANGISGSVATATSTPAITLVLGAITPTTVNGVTISGSSTPTLAVTGTTAVSGTNTGDQTSVTGNAGTATTLQNSRTIGTATGDVTSAGSSFNGSANNTNALTLATVNGNVGSFGSATQVAQITINAKGLTTAGANVTITPAVGSITGLGTGVATWLATPSSVNLATAVTDETGSGSAVFSFDPALTGTPTAPTASAGTNTTQIASTAFVQSAFTGGVWKNAVKAATTGNGTLATAFENADALDGVTLATGDRILLKNQTTGSENGIYTVNASGAPTRATDMDAGTEAESATVFVAQGTLNRNSSWYQITDAVTIGTTAQVWISTLNYYTPEQFGAVGNGSTNDQAAIQLAVDAAGNAAGGGAVFFGKKNYRITSTITFAVDGVKVFGSGYLSIISTTSNITLFTITSTKIHVENLTLLGNNSGAAQNGMVASGNAGLSQDRSLCSIINVQFVNLNNTGAYVTNMVGGSSGSQHQGAFYFVNCLAQGCGTGFYMDSRGEYNRFANCVAVLNATGVRFNGGNNVWIGGSITDNTTQGVYCGTGTNDGHGLISASLINHNVINVNAVSTSNSFLFDGCMLYAGDITINGATGIKFTDCDFNAAVTLTMTFTSAVDCEFTDCKFVITPTISVVSGATPVFNNPRYMLGVLPAGAHDVTLKTILTDNTQTGNVGTGEDVLQTYSLPASRLAYDKDYLTGRLAGTFASSVNTKRIRLKFGATTIFDTGILAITAASNWVMTWEVVRTGATTQKCNVTFNCSDGTVTTVSSNYATAAETLSGAVTVQATGEATSNNDVVKEMFRIKFEGAEQ